MNFPGSFKLLAPIISEKEINKHGVKCVFAYKNNAPDESSDNKPKTMTFNTVGDISLHTLESAKNQIIAFNSWINSLHEFFLY